MKARSTPLPRSSRRLPLAAEHALPPSRPDRNSRPLIWSVRPGCSGPSRVAAIQGIVRRATLRLDDGDLNIGLPPAAIRALGSQSGLNDQLSPKAYRVVFAALLLRLDESIRYHMIVK